MAALPLRRTRMSYVDPNTVTAPKAHWKLYEVLVNTGPGWWSVALVADLFGKPDEQVRRDIIKELRRRQP